MKISKSTIEALRCRPDRREIIVFDQSLPGFGVRVTAKGTKTYIFQYQLGGRSRRRMRLMLGIHPGTAARGARLTAETTAAEARRRAEECRVQTRRGVDPAPPAGRPAVEPRTLPARAAVTGLTVAELIALWTGPGLQDRSESHRSEANRALTRLLKPLADRAAGSVVVEDLRPLFAGEVKRANDAGRPGILARRCRDYGRAAWNWAERHGHLAGQNPFDRLAIDVRERSRDRVLSDRELGEAWRAARSLGYPYGPLVQMLILTLQRRGEVAGMRWSEMSSDFTTWTIPKERAKNNLAHVVHLAPAARGVLKLLHRHRGVDFIFTVNGKAPPSDFSSAAAALRKAIEEERAEAENAPALDWTWHDTRRTGVSRMAQFEIPVDVADRVLNHVSGSRRGAGKVYQRYDFLPERRRALRLWAIYVQRAGRNRR